MWLCMALSSGLVRMAKKRHRNDRLQCGGRPKGTCDKYGNPTSLEHPSTDSLSQPKASSAANDDDDIEVVVDSQESVGSSQYAENSDDDSIIILEDDEWEDFNYDKRMDFKFKAKEICLLYAKFGGKEWEYPLQSECPFRDEYRQLYFITSICLNLDELLCIRLQSTQNLFAQRMESFNQMKTLCLRLEAYIKEDLTAEKYLSFDDTTQRDALEIMSIRYEELSDDIFGCDGDCVSLFDDDEMSICSDHRTRNQSTSSSEYLDSGANYAEICMQSKLTEVGLRYVNKAYKVLRQTNATVTEYRKKTSQCVENLRAVDLKLSQIRQEFGNLSLLVAEAIDSDWIWYAGPSIKKEISS